MSDKRPLDDEESILQEAHRVTHGSRQKDYGHPLDNYTHTAALVSALLANKLTGPITPHEMALVMCCVKMSREMHQPKRDNRTDLAGYAWVADRIVVEQEERRTREVPTGTEHNPGDAMLLDIPKFLRRNND